MRQVIILILSIFLLVQCGTTGGLQLDEGVVDRSHYKYPPEVDTTCYPSDLECEDDN